MPIFEKIAIAKLLTGCSFRRLRMMHDATAVTSSASVCYLHKAVISNTSFKEYSVLCDFGSVLATFYAWRLYRHFKFLSCCRSSITNGRTGR